MGLELMKITGYTDENYQQAIEGKPYEVMMNPENIKWARKIKYNEEQPPDSSTASQKYLNTPSDTLSFDIVIDCTGIVDKTRTDMYTEITALETIIYTYNGEIHRPNYVGIMWGKSLAFNGVLETFDLSYTLFRPDGSPLRAKISLGFAQYMSASTAQKLNKRESPDVTHLVDVVQGISLPQLCQNTWNDSSYYIQVARYNGLNKFRNLKGIERLIFPPIIQPA